MTTLQMSLASSRAICLLAIDGVSSSLGLHSGKQLQQIWRIVIPNGLLFHVRSVGKGRCPDGSYCIEATAISLGRMPLTIH